MFWNETFCVEDPHNLGAKATLGLLGRTLHEEHDLVVLHKLCKVRVTNRLVVTIAGLPKSPTPSICAWTSSGVSTAFFLGAKSSWDSEKKRGWAAAARTAERRASREAERASMVTWTERELVFAT